MKEYDIITVNGKTFALVPIENVVKNDGLYRPVVNVTSVSREGSSGKVTLKIEMTGV